MDKLTIEAATDNLQQVTDFATERLEEHDCPMKVVMQMELVIEEVFVNVSSYAYRPDVGNVTICLDFAEEPASVEITFIDSGRPYNPLEKDDPDTTLGINEREIGGLGIFLVKKNVDDIAYEYTDKQNILRIKKFF